MMDNRRLTSETERFGSFEITRLKLLLPSLPERFEGFTFIQLTDFHLGSCTSADHIEKALSYCRKLDAELLVLTGDYVQVDGVGFRHLFATRFNPELFDWKGYRRSVRSLAENMGEMLNTLSYPEGTIGVFGNHDYLEGIGTIRRRFPRAIRWLRNNSFEIKRDEQSVVFSGIDDLRQGTPDLRATVASSREIPQAGARILLSHNPDIAVERNRPLLEHYDLVLSGHTHGGQLCLPGGRPLVTRTNQRKHIAGAAYLGTTPVYVNRGLGFGGMPFRLFCPPEIAVFTLSRGSSS